MPSTLNVEDVPRKRALGAFYTPAPLARFVAERMAAYLPSGPIWALDPACGDGSLLRALTGALQERDIRPTGIDIDSTALARAASNLGTTVDLREGDFLSDQVLTATRARPDVIIANPPWGGTPTHSASIYRALGYELAVGQFDQYELFIERTLQVLRPGGVLGFIIPDSLFLPEHARTRRLLLERSQLREVVRLGEGLFSEVFRGCMVVVATAGPPASDALVRCGRLDRNLRTRVIAGDLPIADAITDEHRVPQARFAANPHWEINLDVAQADATFDRIGAAGDMDWRSTVSSGRGVELGKRGMAVECVSCGMWRSVPKSRPVTCAGCDDLLDTRNPATLVRPYAHEEPGWAAFIAGEDVQRYSVIPRRQIRTDVPGIRYKADLQLCAPKLLVRKTGVGLTAAIDETGSMTTQSVFHFRPVAGVPGWVLWYLLGALNSRLMAAYHLKRTGDTEWRSHPYVTPRQLMRLPIVDPVRNGATEHVARRVADGAQSMSEAPSDLRADYRVEDALAELYGLTAADGHWVESVLSSAQQLRPIAKLRAPREAASA